MRGYRSFSNGRSGRSDSTGCGIFLVILILMPVLGYVTETILFLMRHIKVILVIFVALFMLKVILSSKAKREK